MKKNNKMYCLYLIFKQINLSAIISKILEINVKPEFA